MKTKTPKKPMSFADFSALYGTKEPRPRKIYPILGTQHKVPKELQKVLSPLGL